MNPQQKRFVQKYSPVYDAVASADIDQEAREALARDLADRLEAGNVPGRQVKQDPDFRYDLFVLLASDPLVPCAGFTLHSDGRHVACPHGRVIRVAMHDSSAEDGRSRAWQRRMPTVQCVSCGAMRGEVFQRNVLSRGCPLVGFDPDKRRVSCTLERGHEGLHVMSDGSTREAWDEEMRDEILRYRRAAEAAA